jgi:YCII-related domain
MAEYILLMHKEAVSDPDAWAPYLDRLSQSGMFEGGSEFGDGICARKTGHTPGITEHLGGYIRINAADIGQARSALAGNPHYEAGGTVEIRELPRTQHVSEAATGASHFAT